MAPTSSIVSFNFTLFDLAQGDSLEVKHSATKTFDILEKFTKDNLPGKLHKSKGMILWITFKTDREYVGQGFIMNLFFEELSTGK